MTGRVRKLVDPEVYCMCSRVTVDESVQPFTPEDAIKHFVWQQGLHWKDNKNNFTCELSWEEKRMDSGETVLVPCQDAALCIASKSQLCKDNQQPKAVPA